MGVFDAQYVILSEVSALVSEAINTHVRRALCIGETMNQTVGLTLIRVHSHSRRLKVTQATNNTVLLPFQGVT